MLPAEVAEGFHLAFLTALADSAGADSFALKGGSNIRFYFSSLRFSEDIDLDVFARDPRTFTGRVEKAFGSQALSRLLSSIGVTVIDLNPKDRSTTRERWMVGLRHRSLPADVRTKVELSHRTSDLSRFVTVERVPASAVARYAPLPAPLVAHYLPAGAIAQKATTIGQRSETQPRDVFDLDHLSRMFPSAPVRGLVAETDLSASIERVYEIGFPEYRSKVVPFIEPSLQASFDSQDVWGAMQVRAIEALEGMRA